MFFESVNPLTSRERYASRRLLVMAEIAFLFVTAVAVASLLVSLVLPGQILPMLVCDAIALAAAYYLYVAWSIRPIKLKCPNCGKLVLSNTPWVCGDCDYVNAKPTEYPFVYHCGNTECGAEPKSYTCHHCEKPIFLSDDRDKKGSAIRFVPEVDDHEHRVKELKQRREIKSEKREIALVDKDLAETRKQVRILKGHAKGKGLKDELKKGVDSQMELEEATVELEATYREKYKDNKPMLKRMLMALKAKADQLRHENTQN